MAEDSARVASRWGRAILLLLLAVWSWPFITSPISANYPGSSFLHLVSLPFHEAGHILFSPFGAFMMSLGGSLTQVLVPLVCLIAFLKQDNRFAAAVTLWWAGENLIDLAPYIDDARSLQLVLLGGRTGMEVEGHDWEAILQTLGWLRFDHAIARTAHVLGAVLMIGALVWGMAVVRDRNAPDRS